MQPMQLAIVYDEYLCNAVVTCEIQLFQKIISAFVDVRLK